MKHKNTLGMVLLIIFTMFQTQKVIGQKNSKAYFSEFGVSFFTDFFSSSSVPITTTYAFDSDVNGNPRYIKAYGHVKYNSFNFASVNYTPRFNLYEFKSNKSISIESHLTIGFGVGFKNGYLTTDDSVKSYYNSGENPRTFSTATSVFTFSAPIFISYNYGMGSTYSCDDDYGYNIGIGLDNTKPLVWMEGADYFDDYGDTKKSNFYFIPAISVGFRKWKKDKASEINLKVGYWPSNETISYLPFKNTGFENGFSMRLSFNKILNL